MSDNGNPFPSLKPPRSAMTSCGYGRQGRLFLQKRVRPASQLLARFQMECRLLPSDQGGQGIVEHALILALLVIAVCAMLRLVGRFLLSAFKLIFEALGIEADGLLVDLLQGPISDSEAKLWGFVLIVVACGIVYIITGGTSNGSTKKQ